jgi:non-ribosomal peptide synthetase component F
MMAQNGESRNTQSQLSIIAGPKNPELLDWTFNDVLRNACINHPNRTAVISQHQNEGYSYLELQARSTRLAVGLHSLGVGKGDRVGVLLGNRAEYVDVSSRSPDCAAVANCNSR